MTRLWESKHEYYCSESSNPDSDYESWQDFIGDMGNTDLDYNLLFRWDWESPREDDDYDREKPIKWQGDKNYRDSTLKLFFMGQRKGVFFHYAIQVCRADEAAIRKYLRVRSKYLMALWAPLGSKEE